MSERKFFYVFQKHGRFHFAIYHDLAPLKSQLEACGNVVFRQELFGAHRAMTTAELGAEYARRLAEGTLPPDNMAEKPKAARVPLGGIS